MLECASSPPASKKTAPLLCLLAALAPAVAVVIEDAFTLAQATMTTPSVAVSMALSGLWAIAVPTVRSMRRFFVEFGGWLIDRIPFAVQLLLAVTFALGATGGGNSIWVPLTAWAVVMVIASARVTAMRDARRFAFTLVSITFGAILLLVCDLVVRIVVLPKRSHNSLYVVHDPYLGWKLRSELSVERNNDSYSSRETINSLGFRSPEVAIAKPTGTKRVLVLGDSHTEGYTVSDGETYPERLQSYLGEEKAVQVISLGVGGYSTDQELLAYIHYGRQYLPDVVVLQFCANDIEFNVHDSYWRGLKPPFSSRRRRLALVRRPGTRHAPARLSPAPPAQTLGDRRAR